MTVALDRVSNRRINSKVNRSNYMHCDWQQVHIAEEEARDE